MHIYFFFTKTASKWLESIIILQYIIILNIHAYFTNVNPNFTTTQCYLRWKSQENVQQQFLLMVVQIAKKYGNEIIECTNPCDILPQSIIIYICSTYRNILPGFRCFPVKAVFRNRISRNGKTKFLQIYQTLGKSRFKRTKHRPSAILTTNQKA